MDKLCDIIERATLFGSFIVMPLWAILNVVPQMKGVLYVVFGLVCILEVKV